MVQTFAKSILERAMSATQKSMSPHTAQEILQWNLTAEDNHRMSLLEERSKQEPLNDEESQDLGEFLMTIDVLSLFHLHAKESLRLLNPAGA